MTLDIIGDFNKAATLISCFKQIAVNQTSEEKRVFNVKEYIGGILSSLHSVTKTAVMTINVNCPDDLVVESYPGALSQIVTNLIMNSVIHGFKNIKEGKIDINASCVEDLLSLKYSDNGVGIEAKNLAKIFDPFLPPIATMVVVALV